MTGPGEGGLFLQFPFFEWWSHMSHLSLSLRKGESGRQTGVEKGGKARHINHQVKFYYAVPNMEEPRGGHLIRRFRIERSLALALALTVTRPDSRFVDRWGTQKSPRSGLDCIAQCATTKLLVAGSSLTAAATTTTSARNTTCRAAAATASATPAAPIALVALEGVGHAGGAGLEDLFVGLEDAHGLLRDGDGLALQARQLDALAEDDGVVDLVERRRELLVRDHLGDDGRDLLGVELKHARQRRHRERVVVRCVCEEVCPESFLLDLRRQHLLDLVLVVAQEIPDDDLADQLLAFLPVSLSQSLGRLHHMVTGVLGWSLEYLSLRVLEHSAERFGDDPLADVGGGSGLCQQGISRSILQVR